MTGYNITGQKEVIKNLNKAINGIENNSYKGIQKAVKFVAAKSSEKTPVEDFNLIKSIRVKSRRVKGHLIGVVGYMSKYAAKVHEASGKLKGQWRDSGKGRYWDVTGEPKFLQKAVTQNTDEIFNIIKKEAGKKPR